MHEAMDHYSPIVVWDGNEGPHRCHESLGMVGDVLKKKTIIPLVPSRRSGPEERTQGDGQARGEAWTLWNAGV